MGERETSSLHELITDINKASHGELQVFEHTGESVIVHKGSVEKKQLQANAEGKILFSIGEIGYWISDQHVITKSEALNTKGRVFYHVVNEENIILVQVQLYK